MARSMPSCSGTIERTADCTRSRYRSRTVVIRIVFMNSPKVSIKEECLLVACSDWFFLLLFTLDGQMYFIRGWHLREFGFPRTNDVKKVFKWKKMNFTTDLPKQDPICSYLVATGKVESECYRMHVVVNSREYNKEYRKSDVLKELKFCQTVYERNNRNTPGFRHQDKEKQKLLPQDREANTERIILCHVTKIKESALHTGAGVSK